MDKQPKENPARMHAKLVEVTEFSDEVMAHVQRLLAQYTPNRSPFLKYTLCTILNSTSYALSTPTHRIRQKRNRYWVWSR